MGLANRDYYRNTQGAGGQVASFADVPQVCKMLLIANVVVFLAQILMTRPVDPAEVRQQIFDRSQQSGQELSLEQIEQMASFAPRQSIVESWFQLDPAKVARGQVWRLVTSAFCHSRFGIWHLVFNMLFLFWFGTRLEQMYGSREFALFYFASAVVASLAFVGLSFYTGEMVPAIGASGAVWGVIALYAFQYPYETIRVYFLFPVQIRWLALLYFVLDLHPVLLALSGDGMHDGVAHAAHLGGAIFGFGYYRQGWRIEPYWNRLPLVGSAGSKLWQAPQVHRRPVVPVKRKRSQEIIPMRSLDPELERLELSLDQVLEKIHRDGRESLSAAELAVLEKASRKYRGDNGE